jgi:predicted transcriptional regulator
MKKTVTITLRLTPEEEKVLDRVARALRATRSEALRAVLKDKGLRLEREESMSAHDRLKHYIPEALGPLRKRSLALNASEEFLKIVQEKHARRSR